MPAIPIDALETPALVVDLTRMERNLARVAAYAREHGIALRPHAKTHKSVEVARAQVAAGAVGLTCATPAEAEVLATAATDLLVAYPPVGAARIARLLALPREVRLSVALDSAAAVHGLAAAARAADREVGVLVELDAGMRRVGVADVPALVELARLVSRNAPLVLDGIAVYPGHIRQRVDAQDEALVALERSVAAAVEALTAAGMPPRVVSGGSTPTLFRTHELPSITEMRPGTYVYNDRTTAAIGACAWDDCALTVLATVVSTAVRGQAVVDAGTKALGREPMRGEEGEGFGALLDRPDVTVRAMSEEHGLIDLTRSDWRPAVGERVRIVPNHVCVSVHLHDVVYGMRGAAIERTWPVAARGRLHHRL